MGTTSEKLTYLNTTKTLIKEELNLGGANISTEPFRAYSSKLKGIYKDFLAHGTDVLWNNWEKVSGSGETLSLTPTIKGKMKVDLKGNTQQNGTPTPDTPIDIQVVSGDNTIKVEGKNLFDLGTSANDYTPTNYINSISNNSITMVGAGGASSRGIRLQNFATNKTYTIGFDTNINTNRGLIRIRNSSDTGWLTNSDITFDGWKYNGNYGAWYKDFTKSGNRATATTTIPNGLYWQFGIVNAYNETKTFSNIQIEEGSTATYTPYVSQSYPINLGDIELCKIGTYQDSIVKDNGKWYLKKEIGKVVLNGSETVDTPNTVSYSFNKSTYLPNCNLPSGNTTNYLVNYFSISGVEISTIGKCWVGNSYINFNFDNTNANVNTFKTWLSTHNTEVYYILYTPTYEEITDTTLLSQLEALAYSYEGTTNISQENDDMPFVLDITALKEMS